MRMYLYNENFLSHKISLCEIIAWFFFCLNTRIFCCLHPRRRIHNSLGYLFWMLLVEKSDFIRPNFSFLPVYAVKYNTERNEEDKRRPLANKHVHDFVYERIFYVWLIKKEVTFIYGQFSSDGFNLAAGSTLNANRICLPQIDTTWCMVYSVFDEKSCCSTSLPIFYFLFCLRFFPDWLRRNKHICLQKAGK